jgi:hypothetical protein
MQPEDRVRLRHMLDAARLAVVYASEHSRDSLDVDPLRAHGLIRHGTAALEEARRQALLPLVRAGVQFQDGVQVERQDQTQRKDAA